MQLGRKRVNGLASTCTLKGRMVRKSQCQCRHQISGGKGQACELRVAFGANAWKLGWQYPIVEDFKVRS